MFKRSVFISSAIFITIAVFLLLVIFCYPIKTNAAMTGDSTPSVTVSSGGSITVTPTGMAYGSKAAGTHTAYTDNGGHKVALAVNTNSSAWAVTMARSQNLTSGSYSIPSTGFIYTSVYVSGTPNPPDVYSNQEFGTSGVPSTVTDTPSTPAAASSLVVDVRYDLTIPATQTAASSYQATHTYTLTAS